ncbi:MAG TPA: oxalate decarboxylase family bicupin [Gammaproteobacteria bacterium]|nr:oxalate decarboxylase family bicupin [Gammaproteobacteria bacterium]
MKRRQEPKRTVRVHRPARNKLKASILGPRNPALEAGSPDRLSPPMTDAGTMPNLKWSFTDSHMRLEEGGWARQVTVRELSIAKELAAVNMRLEAGAIRELHWHKESEWAYMVKGRARITAVDSAYRTFADDVMEGDLWFFPAGIPHSIQGLEEDGCEFLLVFDDGSFDENKTFLLSEVISHMPKEVLAKNFGVSTRAFANLPQKELYIFPSRIPGPLTADRLAGAGPVPQWFSHRMLSQEPVRTKSGNLRIVDSKVFAASKTIAAALVEIEPGGMRELHWHPNGDELQYYLSGQARMTVFNAESNASTYDYQAGDIGYVPCFMPHYVENTGSTTLRFLELFRSDHFEDISLAQWLALTPHELVRAHLHISESVLAKIPKRDTPIVPD